MKKEEEDYRSPAISLTDVLTAVAQQAAVALRGCLQPVETGGWLPFREACDYQANPWWVCEQNTMSMLQTLPNAKN